MKSPKNFYIFLLGAILLTGGCAVVQTSPEVAEELRFPDTTVLFPETGVFELHSKGDSLRFRANSRELLWNGVKVVMPSAVKFDENTRCFSLAADAVESTVKPLLNGNTHDHPCPRVIMIDPGHGGSDPGAVRRLLPEKELNLKVALLICRELTARGFKAIMTRNSDRAVSLDQRLAAAKKTAPDIFVSIHHNAAVNTLAAGYEIYAPPPGRQNSAAGLLLAAAIQRRIISGIKVNDRGVKTANFKVLRAAPPAVLIEAGFLSNPSEEKVINTAARQRAVAKAAAAGISDFAARYSRKDKR